jgi:CheY-like chemotaxis protein
MAGKILIVQDDARFSDFLASSLAEAGYEISQAVNSREGISKALAEQPRLILTNLQLPDMIVFDAITILKNNPATSGIPIIVLTATSLKEWIQRELEDELIDLVGKFCRPLLSSL